MSTQLIDKIIANAKCLHRPARPTSIRVERIDMIRGRNFVYFIACNDAQAVKIGQAWNPALRLRQFQCGCPMQLSIAAIVVDHEFQWEAIFQTHFSSSRIRLEWFVQTDELLELIKELNKTAVPFRGCL